MKALTIILWIRDSYENAYMIMLRQYYKLRDNVNAYITLSTRYKDYHNNIVNAYIICYNILQCYDSITLYTLETLCKHATNLDIPTMKALTNHIPFAVSTIKAQKITQYQLTARQKTCYKPWHDNIGSAYTIEY